MTELSLEDCWDHGPCGHVIAQPDGRILRVNATLARWLGYDPNALQGRLFSELFTAGGQIHYDTHFGPVLRMRGELKGVTLDLVTADGARLPMFLTANVKSGSDGQPELLRITAVDAADRRAYEQELPGRAKAGRDSAWARPGICRDTATLTAAAGAVTSRRIGCRRLLLPRVRRRRGGRFLRPLPAVPHQVGLLSRRCLRAKGLTPL